MLKALKESDVKELIFMADARSAIRVTEEISFDKPLTQEQAREFSNINTASLQITKKIESLNKDEIVELMALMWLGRGDDEGESFSFHRDFALSSVNDGSAEYISSKGDLGDYLRDGMKLLSKE